MSIPANKQELRNVLEGGQIVILAPRFQDSRWIEGKIDKQNITDALNKVIAAFKEAKVLTGDHKPLTVENVANLQSPVEAIGRREVLVDVQPEKGDWLDKGRWLKMDLIVAPDVRTARETRLSQGAKTEHLEIALANALRL